jgi:hypothetical protein
MDLIIIIKKLIGDQNVKLQGLKYNFGKVQWCFCKNTTAGNFQKIWNYFSIDNSME